MSKMLKNQVAFFLIMVLMLASFSLPFRAEAFSLDPVLFFKNTANIVVSRVSDIIYYLIMQKKYIFDNYSDPNVYSPLNVPSNINSLLTASSSPVPSAAVVSRNIVTMATATIPKIRNAVPAVISTPSPIVITVPGLVANQNNNVAVNPVLNPVSNYSDNTQILLGTNKERMAASLPPLSANSVLDTVASLRADDMFARQYFDHASPDGQSATDLAKRIGYGYLLIGENLALGNFGSNQGIIDAWMQSPGHRANIINGRYTELGVAVKKGVYNGGSTTIAVQIFGTPLANCAKPNQTEKLLIDNSTASIKQMQMDALAMYSNLTTIKNNPAIDSAYYYQKVQEYNVFAKKVNDAVTALKTLIDSYNQAVSYFNSCIGS